MIEARRRAYLEALGVDVWITRQPAGERGPMGVGKGRGSTLLICPAAADSSTELARDLARALGGDPVWAWLDPDPGEDCQDLEDVVADRLITRVFLFGPEPARALFRGAPPEILGSATVSVLPGLDELAVRGTAKQAAWKQLRSVSSARAVAKPAGGSR
jgi:hypothetical protein